LISITSEGRNQLASTYSRFIDARDVVEPVASRLGLDSTDVDERLSASPIPESPIFRVEGQGTSEAAAVELTEAATASLIDFIRRSNVEDARGEALLRRFQNAIEETRQAEGRRDQAEARLDRNPLSRDAARSLNQALAALEAARLRRETLRDLYRQSQAELVGSRGVEVLDPATDASSDRFLWLQVLLFAGLAGGLVIGVALAHLEERALRRRMGSGLYS
jgi:capsular polysaccharide biosynthesis protein